MAGLLPRLGVLVICAAAGVAAAQDSAPVYKWVDQNGTVNYGDQPPAGTAAEALPIRLRRSSPAPTQARLKSRDDGATAPDSLLNAGEPADEADAADATVPADEREKLIAQRQQNCQKARDRMASYEQAKRIYRPGPTGERVYLSSEEIDAERATARVAVAEWCNE
jgi:hypothetical protein